jgi:hypothetical protein
MLVNGPLIDLPGVDANNTFVRLARGGRIEYLTASPRSREGARPLFAALDQTESWEPQSGGPKLAAVVRRNLTKTGGTSLESPNAYRPGSGSVAEASFQYAGAIALGTAKDDGLLMDHRQAEDIPDLTDEERVLAGLRYAYGDSGNLPCVIHDPPCDPPSWGVDLDRVMRERLDLAVEPLDWKQYHLNQPSATADSFVTTDMIHRLPRREGRRPFSAIQA